MQVTSAWISWALDHNINDKVEIYDSKQRQFWEFLRIISISRSLCDYLVIFLFPVLNVFSGELKITNMEWDPSLGDDSSEIFKIMATEIEEDLKKLFSGNVQ